MNMLRMFQVKKYTDEYSDCEENEPELNEEQSQEKEEESVYC